MVLLCLVNRSPLSCLSYCVLCSRRTHFLNCKTFKWPNFVNILAENIVERSNGHLLLLIFRLGYEALWYAKCFPEGVVVDDEDDNDFGSLSVCGFLIHFVIDF